jgi:AcrR family transcriptional regulator
MPKGFTDKEKDGIRTALIDKGKELFGKYGIRKTSITDLTDAVGIAKGSFYIFYNSKEELFFYILKKTEEEIHGDILHNLLSIDDLSVEKVKTFFKDLYFNVESNSFLKRIMDKDEVNHLWRKLPASMKDENISIDIDTAGNLIQALEERGFTINEDKSILAGILRAIFLIMLHKEEIGERIYPKVINKLIDIVFESLIKENN